MTVIISWKQRKSNLLATEKALAPLGSVIFRAQQNAHSDMNLVFAQKSTVLKFTSSSITAGGTSKIHKCFVFRRGFIETGN